MYLYFWDEFAREQSIVLWEEMDNNFCILKVRVLMLDENMKSIFGNMNFSIFRWCYGYAYRIEASLPGLGNWRRINGSIMTFFRNYVLCIHYNWNFLGLFAMVGKKILKSQPQTVAISWIFFCFYGSRYCVDFALILRGFRRWANV